MINENVARVTCPTTDTIIISEKYTYFLWCVYGTKESQFISFHQDNVLGLSSNVSI